MHPKAHDLLNAQLLFIENTFKNPDVVTEEVLDFFTWFKQKQITDIWSTELINALLQQQILLTPLTQHLITQIEQHLALVLTHPNNHHTTIEEILPVETIDQIAQYISSKTVHREHLIQQLVNSPAYIELITKIVQHSVKDYMDNSMVAKKVPGVGSLMKMGKSVIERATDSNLDDALKTYLHKNFHKLSSLSEKLINQYLTDDQLYQLQAKLWHKIKKAPLSSLEQYVIVADLPNTVGMGTQIWTHLRQTDYLKAQVATGVKAWIQRHEHKTFSQALQDINIDESLLRNELYELIMPIIQTLIDDGYLMEKIRIYLTEFYNSEIVHNILKDQ